MVEGEFELRREKVGVTETILQNSTLYASGYMYGGYALMLTDEWARLEFCIALSFSYLIYIFPFIPAAPTCRKSSCVITPSRSASPALPFARNSTAQTRAATTPFRGKHAAVHKIERRFEVERFPLSDSLWHWIDDWIPILQDGSNSQDLTTKVAPNEKDKKINQNCKRKTRSKTKMKKFEVPPTMSCTGGEATRY